MGHRLVPPTAVGSTLWVPLVRPTVIGRPTSASLLECFEGGVLLYHHSTTVVVGNAFTLHLLTDVGQHRFPGSSTGAILTARCDTLRMAYTSPVLLLRGNLLGVSGL